MILSSLSASELQNAIASENVNLIKSVKGIGLKTAQRVIIDLKDKLGKDFKFEEKVLTHNNTIKEESLSAMVMLGFAKNVAEKALDKILSENNNLTVEELIKKALKIL
jgi:Holliday junction DNA helicase RuvA